MKPIVQYDSSKEDLIERYICQIDKNPTICINPLEETSYLGLAFINLNMYYAEFGDLVKEYKNYVKGFVQSNLVSPESYIYIESTLSWLLIKFQNALKPFVELPLRTEWQMLWHTFKISVPNKNAKIKLEEKNTREAYRYFYLISRFQLTYLEDLIAFISGQLLSIKKTNQEINPIQSATHTKESEPFYIFELTEKASAKSNTILGSIYLGLKNIDYIECTSSQFKRLFLIHPYNKSITNPSPIIWKCKHYNHLAYFIKCMVTAKIITPTKFPSNNDIASKLFYDREKDKFFSRSRGRFNRVSPKTQAKIDAIIEKSLAISK
jgi:hypothetical protein